VLELAEILRYGQQHLLHKIIGVAVLDVVLPQPCPDQRRVQLDEPIPTLGFGGATEAVK
jgi:hypothetical protein